RGACRGCDGSSRSGTAHLCEEERLMNGHRGQRAFTLIELLVVIAIIAILAAILFPVFAQAREKARQSACLSNMKQIGTATMMYVQDYDEKYPDQRTDKGTLQDGVYPNSLP